MSFNKPNPRHLHEVLLFCFNMKETAAEAYQMISSTYGNDAISKRACRELFQRFKDGDFSFKEQHSSGREKAFKDLELDTMLSKDWRQILQEHKYFACHGDFTLKEQLSSGRDKAFNDSELDTTLGEDWCQIRQEHNYCHRKPFKNVSKQSLKKKN